MALAAPSEPPPEPKYAPAGHRWRFSWLASWEGFLASQPAAGTSLSAFFGAGYPVQQRGAGIREAHAFGYWPMVGTTTYPNLLHRHRLGVAGQVSRPRRLGTKHRRIGLFYQAGIGATAYVVGMTGSAGGRLGAAFGRTGRPSLLMTIGGDVDLGPALDDFDPNRSVATFTFSLLGVGWL